VDGFTGDASFDRELLLSSSNANGGDMLNGNDRYLEMHSGFIRLQALVRARILSHRFKHLRGHIVGLQASLLEHHLIFRTTFNLLIFNRAVVEVIWSVVSTV
jgi:hypothetical protein